MTGTVHPTVAPADLKPVKHMLVEAIRDASHYCNVTLKQWKDSESIHIHDDDGHTEYTIILDADKLAAAVHAKLIAPLEARIAELEEHNAFVWGDGYGSGEAGAYGIYQACLEKLDDGRSYTLAEFQEAMFGDYSEFDVETKRLEKDLAELAARRRKDGGQ